MLRVEEFPTAPLCAQSVNDVSDRESVPEPSETSTTPPVPDVRVMSSKVQVVCRVRDVAVTEIREVSDKVIDLNVTVVNEIDPAVSMIRGVDSVGAGFEAAPVNEMLVRERAALDSLVMNVPAETVTDINCTHTDLSAVRAAAVLGRVNASPSRLIFTPARVAPLIVSGFVIVPLISAASNDPSCRVILS